MWLTRQWYGVSYLNLTLSLLKVCGYLWTSGAAYR